MNKNISKSDIEVRQSWIDKISNLSGDFISNSVTIHKELENEVNQFGTKILLTHLRLCGNIPEHYRHDSSEEKLYSKYTDSLLALSFQEIGLKSLVLTERADAADVEAFGKDFSFVADAKAFRLSRTAKNQKDFKIQALDSWKYGKPYAMVVCPIYQLPVRSSQIYQQATTKNVCIFTYSHLAVLLKYAQEIGQKEAESLLFNVFKAIPMLKPSKNATDYWLGLNTTMINDSSKILNFWNQEKIIATETISIAKTEALQDLALERERLIRLSHQEAIIELLNASKIENKIKTVKSISDNDLFSVK